MEYCTVNYANPGENALEGLVTIICENGNIVTERHALMEGSDYFREKLQSDSIVNLDDDIQGFTLQDLQYVILFLCKGMLEAPVERYPAIFTMACYLGVDKLKRLLQLSSFSTSPLNIADPNVDDELTGSIANQFVETEFFDDTPFLAAACDSPKLERVELYQEDFIFETPPSKMAQQFEADKTESECLNFISVGLNDLDPCFEGHMESELTVPEVGKQLSDDTEEPSIFIKHEEDINRESGIDEPSSSTSGDPFDLEYQLVKSVPRIKNKTKKSRLRSVKENKSTVGSHSRTFATEQKQVSLSDCDKILKERPVINSKKCSNGSRQSQVCTKCSKQFPSLEALRLHMWRLHSLGEVFRCDMCSHTTPVRASFAKHLETHKTTKDFTCQYCSKQFKSRGGYTTHLKRHTDGTSIQKCSFCNFTCVQKHNLAKHLANKHGVDEEGNLLSPTFACKECEYTCITSHMLKQHSLRKHTSDKPFKCSDCDYSSVEKAAVQKHIRIRHTNERPYVCDQCSFRTHTISGLARHQRGHEKLKPYKCDQCEQTYADKKRLKDHLLKHSNLKPFVCELCGYACRRKDNLGVHMKKSHKKETSNADPQPEIIIPELASDVESLTTTT